MDIQVEFCLSIVLDLHKLRTPTRGFFSTQGTPGISLGHLVVTTPFLVLLATLRCATLITLAGYTLICLASQQNRSHSSHYIFLGPSQ